MSRRPAAQVRDDATQLASSVSSASPVSASVRPFRRKRFPFRPAASHDGLAGAAPPDQYGSYCVAKPHCNVGQLGGAVGWACGELSGHGFDCASAIPAACGSDLQMKANYVFSTYFEKLKGTGATCDFGGVGVMSDPFKPTPPCVNKHDQPEPVGSGSARSV